MDSDKDGNNLKYELTKGPQSVAIDASSFKFQFYSKGVIENCYVDPELNHGVTAVAWGVENNKEYFLIKNSWGSRWGDKGYVKLSTKSGCGVNDEVVVIELK